MAAIEQGDPEGVKHYLAAGNSADVRVAGSTAADYALSFHEVEIAKALVAAGGTYAYIRASSIDTMSHPNAKGRAEFLTSPAAVKPLLPILQAQEPDVFNRMLMYAAAHGNTASVKALLQAGTDPNVTSSKGLTALDIATLHGDADTVQQLQAAGGKIGTAPNATIDDATMSIDSHQELSTLNDLEKASYLGRTDVVKRLLVQASPEMLTDALSEATDGNNTETVRAILQNGAFDEKVMSGSLLQSINLNDNAEMLDDLLSAADKLGLSDEGKWALRYFGTTGVASIDDVPLYQTFLKHGLAPLHHSDDKAFSPIELVADRGNLDTLDLLLRGGFSPKEEPDALIAAISDGQDQAAERLLQAGADPNVTADSILPGDSMTPLMYAVKASDLDLVQALLQAGADVNAKTVDGTAALALAQARENQAVIKALLAAGAK